ncbi:hypothetical protein [Nocardioides sp. Kera G14]|uniref:hypothetical protein n=1 Tax=Nocardioides sp. Kera G14 TaxID=2884264 RepID=UPI001D11947B|nr:hypothetical protein [Nocardioides sp. Kera G14]UDY22658.1 hypothetical protein LH076_11305 [Nocardioides sp. Kera G14]
MTPHDEIAKLRESLRLTQAELAQARSRLESLMEPRAAADEAAANAHRLAEATATGLAAISSSGSGLRGWVKRRLFRYLPNDEETRDMRTLAASPLFDAAWYLLSNPTVAASGLSPELHYLRLGAAKNYDPGPHFRTRAYRDSHPDIGDDNPLLRHLRGADTA